MERYSKYNIIRVIDALLTIQNYFRGTFCCGDKKSIDNVERIPFLADLKNHLNKKNSLA